MNQQPVYFERALFFSWYCSLGDCTFCYMSTIKDKTQDPKKARRRFSSILAEAILAKQLDWKIEFISGGYHSYTKDELVFLVKSIAEIMGEKQWLNIGYLSKEDLEKFKPYTKGYCGTIETVNWELRKKVCPSKHLEPILKTFKYCNELNIEKAITLILGLGETIDDFKELESFIKKHNVSRITYYALNPHPDTPFKESPTLKYYTKWVERTRAEFPNIDIIAGAWTDKVNYYSELLKAGANSITKLPSVRKFGSKTFKDVENEIKKTNRPFVGSLTILPDVDWNALIDTYSFEDKLKAEIKKKLEEYLKQMRKNHSI